MIRLLLVLLINVLKIAPVITICLLSDLALNRDLSKFTPRPLRGEYMYLKAVCDNLGHGLIALFTWLIVINYDFSHNYWNIICTFLCSLFGSLIDIDHFFAAKSTSLKVAI